MINEKQFQWKESQPSEGIIKLFLWGDQENHSRHPACWPGFKLV